MTFKLLTEYHLEFLSLTSGCTGLFKSRLVKMPHCWLSHVRAHIDTLMVLMEIEHEQFCWRHVLRRRCINQLNTIRLLLSDILYVVQKGLLMRYSLETILDTFFKHVSNYTRFWQVKGVKKVCSVKKQQLFVWVGFIDFLDLFCKPVQKLNLLSSYGLTMNVVNWGVSIKGLRTWGRELILMKIFNAFITPAKHTRSA